MGDCAPELHLLYELDGTCPNRIATRDWTVMLANQDFRLTQIHGELHNCYTASLPPIARSNSSTSDDPFHPNPPSKSDEVV
jgi:hypothetical protein